MGGFVVRIGINPAQQVGSAIIPEATPTSDGVMTAAQAAALAALVGGLGGFAAEATSINGVATEVGRVRLAGDGLATLDLTASATDVVTTERATWGADYAAIIRSGATVQDIAGNPLPQDVPSSANTGGPSVNYRVRLAFDAGTNDLIFSVIGAVGQTVKFAVTVAATVVTV